MDPAVLLAYIRRPADCQQHSATGTAVIDAPVDRVWEVLYAPETLLKIESGSALYAGHVPGTPVRQVGEMQYTINSREDGSLAGNVSVVTELTEGHSALVRGVKNPLAECYQAVVPVSGGTELRLTMRLPAGTGADPELLASRAQNDADLYKAMIEQPDRF